MAERFNLTAQLHLQAPRNVGQVVGQIRRQLHGINANVNVKGDARTIAKVNKELRSVDKHARSSAASVGRLNRNLSEAARRFSVITVATGTMLAFAHAVKNAVGEAISFERELVKISQVSGKSVRNLQGLTKEITRLSTSLGASSADLLSVSRTLTQAGFSAQKTKQALDILAKTSLGATFDDIKNTTEGAIAVLRQFRAEAQRAGGDIKFLEQTMDAINAVSKRFAVESNDLISVIRRVGGVFESAGGSVNELIALFTSVRATTRETAETIATGLRTIFTRIQRTETVDQLRQLGIELRNAQGQFVGSYEAVRRLSEGLAGLDPRDFRFSQIVEQLGGFRQIGKVIPLIRQFTTAQEALNVAQAASGSVTRDAITAQQSLAVQAAKVREEFSALMRNLADSSTFRSIANGALELAKAFIKVTEAIKPVLPLLTLMIGMKIGRALAPGLGAIAGVGRGRATGGKIHKFSTGGFVPGVGNSDSVPAMLQPGEYVIKKSSAQKLGASNLHAMNGYNTGGRVAKIQATRPQNYGVFALNADKESLATEGRKVDRKTALDRLIPQIVRKEATKGAKAAQANLVGKSGAPSKGFSDWLHGTKKISTLKPGTASAYKAMKPATQKSLQKEYLNSRTSKTKGAQGQKSDITGVSLKGPFNVLGISGKNNKGELMQDLGPDFEKASRAALKVGVKKIAQSELVKNLNIPPIKADEQKLFNFNGLFEGAQETLEGYLLEGVIGALTAAKIGGGGINFDFPKLTKTAKERLKKLFGENNAVTPMIAADAKRTASSATSGENSIQNKIASVLEFADFQLLNRGGAVDSVPAMLTPGEYVVNRSSAQAIGYSNLNKMNKTGVQHFANGGVVQYMSNGGKKDAGGVPKFNPRIIAGPATKISQKLAKIVANFEAMGLSTEQMEKATKVAEKALRTKTKGGKKVEGTGLGMEAAFKKGLEETSRQQTKKERVGGAPVIGPQPLAAGAKEQREPLSVGSGPKFGQQKAANTLAENQAKASAELKSYTSDQNSLNKGISAYNHAIREGKSHEKAMSRARQASAKALRGGSQITQAGFEKAEKLNAARGVLASKLGSAAKTVGKRAIAAPVKGVAGGIGTVGKGVGTALRGLDPFSAGGAAARQKTGEFAQGAGQKVQGTAAAMQQFVFLGAAVTAVTSQMSGLSETTKRAVNETAGFAAGIVGITGTVVQTMTSLITSNAAETLASTQSAVADNAEAAASSKAAAAGATFGGALSGMMIGISAAVVALKFFSAKNKAIADESKKKWTSALDNIKTSAGASAEEITKSMGAEMEARTKSAKQMDGTAIGMVASMAATGAAIGAFGGPLGAAIGGVVGAGIGFAGAMLRAESATDATLAARNQEVDAIKKTVTNLVDLNNAQRNLSEALADIDAAGLSPERQIQMRLQAGGAALRTDAAGKSAEADARISKIAAQIGASSAAVRATGGDKDKLQALAKKSGMGANKANEVAARASTALTAELMAQKSAQELVAATVKATSDTYAKAADGIRAASNFTELRKALPAFAASLKQKQQALDEAAQLEIAAADQKVDIAAKEGGATLAAAKQNLIDVKKRHAQAAKLANEGHRKTIEAVKKRIREDLLAAKAAEAFRQQMIKTNKFMKQLGAVSDANAKQTKRLKGQQALIENKDLDFNITQAQGLGDLKMVRDLKKFERELRTSIADLPPVMRAEALKLAKGVKETAILVTKGKEFLVGKRIGPRDKAPSAADILKSVGIDPKKVDKSILGNMQTQVAKAFEDQVLSADEFDKIFKPFVDVGQAQAKQLAAIQGEVNKALSNHAMALNNQLAVLEKRRAAELNMIDIQNKNEVMLAKARGADDSDINAILDRQERKRAQVALGGVGVRAGDIGGAVAAREAAEKRRAEIEKERHNMNLSTAARKKLMTEDKKMQIVIQRTTAEIQRLGNQSEKAGRLMDQIDAERAKREVLTGLVTDFVVGGQEERQAMQKSFMGIQFAMATGTLQTQSPEQRQATVGMLDTLADIEIPGAGGMTGKEVKQKLVFDDAVRMGLDPKIAQQLAKATSKEEKLITALEKLTVVMEKANKVEAEGKAMGGLVHLAGGGSTIFKPRGTDTVPAMLTPGEFVIKKSSVDKYGVGMMSAINAGRFADGGVVYAYKGKAVGTRKEYQMPEALSGAPRSKGFRMGMLADFLNPYLGIEKNFDGTPIKQHVRGKLGSGIRRAGHETGRTVVGFDLLLQDFLGIHGSKSKRAGFGAKTPEPTIGPSRLGGQVTPAVQKAYDEMQRNKKRGSWMEAFGFATGGPVYAHRVASRAAVARVENDPFFMKLQAERDRQKQEAAPRFHDFAAQDAKTRKAVRKARLDNAQKGMNAKWKRNHFNNPNSPYYHKSAKQVRFMRARMKRARSEGAARRRRLGKPEFTQQFRNRFERADMKAQQRRQRLQMRYGQRFADGGQVDSVPAMLTPGEFVMSRGAVQRYGTGFMSSLNRGNVPGFNSGGFVGAKYLQNGSTSAVKRGGGFNFDSLAGMLDTMTKAFPTLNSVITKLQNVFSDLNMTHNFKGDMSLAFSITNADSLKQSVADAITPHISDLITRELDNRLGGFNATGP